MNDESLVSRVDVCDAQALRKDFEWAVSERDSSVFARMELNYKTRFTVWKNQSEDGRKWRSDKGKKVFPWLGASDARVPLVDRYIKEDAAFLMTVWRRMRTVVSGTETQDTAFGQRLTQLLRWMKYTQMKESGREHRYLSNLFLERGAGVMGVFWEKQEQLGYTDVDMEDVVQIAQQASASAAGASVTLDPNSAAPNRGGGGAGIPPALLEVLQMLPALVMDAAYEEQVVEVAKVLYPDIAARKDGTRILTRAVAELRENGHTRLPQKYVKKDRPTLVALALNEDVFLPPEASDLEYAPGVYRRELLTDVQLRERVGSHDWNEAWVEEIIETQRGVMSIELDVRSGNSAIGRTLITLGSRGSNSGGDSTSKLFEVVHAYRRMADVEGVPGIYYSCFNPGLLRRMDSGARSGRKGRKGYGSQGHEGYGYHDLLNYEHGEYPFVIFEREKISRRIDDSRGYGEVASTWQNQIKVEWDSRVDRASIATLPPSYHPPGEAPDAWGPGVEVPTVRREQYGFMEIPKWDPGSKEVEESVRKFADGYFGRATDELDQSRAMITQQDLADVWMECCAEVDGQVLQLCQQFMPDEFYFRVVGSSKGRGIKATREEIQGKFDVSVGYNVENLDAKLKAEKMGLIEKLLQMDVNGIVDRDEAMEVTADLIDPSIGERLLKPAENATQAEMEDERAVFAQLMAGVSVDIKPQGQAYELRLKVLQNLLQTNPTAQRAMMSGRECAGGGGEAAEAIEFSIGTEAECADWEAGGLITTKGTK
jgi:hypothetical protein